MVDEPLEDSVGPWGRASILFKHHRYHAPIKLIEVFAKLLAIGSAFCVFFVVFSWLFRSARHKRCTIASSLLPRQLAYPGGHHADVSPGEDIGSWRGLAPKKNSSEEVGLAKKGLAPGYPLRIGC